ncbi:MAG TPA: AMP-binding protein [Ktedonobacterales bacterium]|nr:AMP-binding protein [Ktedonobacterales bacterium]
MVLVQTLDAPPNPVPSSQLCLHEVLTRQAALTPEVVAVVEGTASLTYRQLEAQANQLAHVLSERDVGPEVVVGLALTPGRHQVDALVALFAILKAGGAVLTLSDFYPPAQIAAMVEEAAARLIVAVEGSEARRMEESLSKHVPILCLEDAALQQRVEQQPNTPPSSGVGVTNLAYLIYTSGSTGTPKGVLCTHTHLAPLGQAQGHLYEVHAGDRVGHSFAWQFDGLWSVIATAITNGATLCLPEQGVLDSGAHTVAWIEREGIGLMFCTPSYLATWPDIHLPTHPAIVVAGESCPEDLAKRYAAKCRCYTAYGPAEAGICLTTGRYGGQGTPTLGMPLPYVRFMVLDAQGLPVPRGQAGEIVVEYPQARGYLNPDETKKRFRDGRYHTGDHATWLPDGSLLFAGRTDAQVKLPGGVLCNLEQIEQLLGAHEHILASKALWREHVGIVLYVVPKERRQLSTRVLRDYLAAWLPEPIVARCVSVELEVLPLSPNGKVDPNPDHYPDPSVRELVDYIGEVRPPSTATEIGLAQLVADLTNSPFHPTTALAEVNVLATLPELGLDSLTLGYLEVQIAGQWHQSLTQEQAFTWPLYRIAAALARGPKPFPDLEVR